MNRDDAKACIDAIIGTWDICQYQKYPSAVDVEIDDEDIVVLKMAITALSQEQQSEWERDHEILKAYADGQESMKPRKDAISRQDVLNILDDMVKDYVKENDFDKAQGVAWVKVQKLPSVSTEKTVENGFCLLYEPKESEV